MNISDRWEAIIIFQSTNDCIGPRRGWWMKLKMGSAGLGLVMGVLVFVVFTFVYGELWALIIGPERNKITISGNVCAGLWAVVSSLLSALVLHQHILFSRGTLAQIYNPKRYNVQLRASYNQQDSDSTERDKETSSSLLDIMYLLTAGSVSYWYLDWFCWGSVCQPQYTISPWRSSWTRKLTQLKKGINNDQPLGFLNFPPMLVIWLLLCGPLWPPNGVFFFLSTVIR